MRLLIDGHNLIPKVPGLTLRDPDDEHRLLDILTVYAREQRATIEVFFDKAPPNLTGSQTLGRVQAHFVSAHTTADAAIGSRLRTLKKNARQWVVVSSDHAVQQNARACGAQVMPSEEFARRLAPPASKTPADEKPEYPLNADDIAYWMRTFQARDNDEHTL
ncbi:MAG: NYN domain-containing protein [Anaerolineales bacterium]